MTAVHEPGRRRRSIPALFLGGGVLRRKRWTEQRYHKFVNSQRLNYADVCCPSARDRLFGVPGNERERQRQRQRQRDREPETRAGGRDRERGEEDAETEGRRQRK